MKTVTLTFPNYEALWQFKDQSKAINVRIEPKRHRISGLFNSEEVAMAVDRFQAAQAEAQSKDTSESRPGSARTSTSLPRFRMRYRLNQLFALVHL